MGLATLALTACGEQSEDDTAGEFEVKVVDATFPDDQKLARNSDLTIEVENSGSETIPDIAVTVNGFNYELTEPGDAELPDPSVADPERPRFIVNRSPIEFLPAQKRVDPSLVDREVAPPYGRQTAFVNTYTLGELPAGESAVFRWNVTAVQPGPYDLEWTVDAGTGPDTKAVDSGGSAPSGGFSGVVEDAPVEARIGKDGKTVISGDRKTKY
ncbi:MAG: hypothetical protein H0U42_10210 [Thermoleophilaceae bacterium]|nr:hypothetical protein [Thermoleophilaceae bacterium]